MTKEDYERRVAEYDAKCCEFKAKADKLEQAERVLVFESQADDAHSRVLVAKYDIALQARDEAGIADYMTGVKELNKRQIARKSALDAVRAEYYALERERPRRPRRSWSQVLTMKNWFLHPVYAVGSFFLAFAVFFLVPLPWYFALLVAIGTYFATVVLSVAMMVITKQ
jgi:hypothetical protein